MIDKMTRLEILLRAMFLNNLKSVLNDFYPFSSEGKQKILNKGIDYLNTLKNGNIFLNIFLKKEEPKPEHYKSFWDFVQLTNVVKEGIDREFHNYCYSEKFLKDIDNYIGVLERIASSKNYSTKGIPKKELKATTKFISRLNDLFHNYDTSGMPLHEIRVDPL